MNLTTTVAAWHGLTPHTIKQWQTLKKSYVNRTINDWQLNGLWRITDYEAYVLCVLDYNRVSIYLNLKFWHCKALTNVSGDLFKTTDGIDWKRMFKKEVSFLLITLNLTYTRCCASLDFIHNHRWLTTRLLYFKFKPNAVLFVKAQIIIRKWELAINSYFNVLKKKVKYDMLSISCSSVSLNT